MVVQVCLTETRKRKVVFERDRERRSFFPSPLSRTRTVFDFSAGELEDPLRDPCRLMEISQDQSGVLYNLFEYVIY